MQGNFTASTQGTNTVSEAESLVLLDEDNRELVAFQHCDKIPESLGPLTDLAQNSLAHFSQLFSNVPQLASLSASKSKHLVMCSVDFDKLIDAKDGAGKLGIANKPGSTQFGEHVRLNKPEKLQSIVTTGMVFNIASTLVAQQHLAEINKKLELIQNGIKEISKFQKNERTSNIIAFHEQIQSSVQRISDGKSINKLTVDRLSQYLMKVRAISIHLKTDFAEDLVQLEKLDSSSIFGSDLIREEIKKSIESTGIRYREYMLSMQCLVMANAILFFQSGFDDEFRENAQRYLRELDAVDGVAVHWEKYQKKVQLKLNKMHSWFELKNSTQANILLVGKTTAKVRNQLSEDKNHLIQITTMFFPQKKSQIILEIEEGHIVGGQYLV